MEQKNSDPEEKKYHFTVLVFLLIIKEEYIRFREIAKLLREEFLKPEWIPGKKLESEPEMMNRFTASRKTIRNAMKVLVDEGIVLREHGRRCTLLRKPLDKKKFRKGLNFCLLGNQAILDSTQTDVPEIANGMIEVLSRHDITLTLFPFLTRDFPLQLEPLKNLVERNIVDGIFVMWTKDIFSVCEYLTGKQIPFTVIRTWEPTKLVHEKMITRYPYLFIKESESLLRMVQHLKERGTKEIILFGMKEDFLPMRTDALLAKATAEASVSYKTIRMEGKSPGFLFELLKLHHCPRKTIVASNALVREIRFAVSILGGHEPKGTDVVFFKHFSPDWKDVEKDYIIFSRPIHNLGVAAAELMLNVYSGEQPGVDMPIEFESLYR